METKIPFIFARISESGQLDDTLKPIKDWVVFVARPDFRIYNSEWMDHEGLGKVCLVPDVDIVVEEDKVFQTYHDAREYVRQWWCAQQ